MSDEQSCETNKIPTKRRGAKEIAVSSPDKFNQTTIALSSYGWINFTPINEKGEENKEARITTDTRRNTLSFKSNGKFVEVDLPNELRSVIQDLRNAFNASDCIDPKKAHKAINLARDATKLDKNQGPQGR